MLLRRFDTTKQATNKNTFDLFPVTGSVKDIVLPDQSTSMLCPALWPTREEAPVIRT